jgi:hypothetical protein
MWGKDSWTWERFRYLTLGGKDSLGKVQILNYGGKQPMDKGNCPSNG